MQVNQERTSDSPKSNSSDTSKDALSPQRTSCDIFLANLPESLTADGLRNMFEELIGTVESSRVASSKKENSNVFFLVLLDFNFYF